MYRIPSDNRAKYCKSFLRSGRKQRGLLSLVLFSIAQEYYSVKENKYEKLKWWRLEKKQNCQFSETMIEYVENPMESTNKLLKLLRG